MAQQDNQAHPHKITIEPAERAVTVVLGDETVARSSHALVLKEGALPPVYYLPREDVNMSLLEPTDHSTHCPFK
ncbi:MAG: DUF427 domain-containing protein, partial [Alphaproteobacteria bacterium]|nr:DUF427 domain-containing protein [Alphaproteobacteria bacterium]